ncbi:hypothetical protein HMPREF1624_05058 [Sporothrix schenckii ATCC 58251]|uniref:Uncharacterized protein n=1 Tax=Sporothrix schenckii (strain ATCC 58251 / de Perez 2211183) TaxID=1391915 RepID=U7PUW2_SPOS1|nr:hypothetical protein HMPREF1624_05058 [Sporothrix schenckii ATCC 58251]
MKNNGENDIYKNNKNNKNNYYNKSNYNNYNDYHNYYHNNFYHNNHNNHNNHINHNNYGRRLQYNRTMSRMHRNNYFAGYAARAGLPPDPQSPAQQHLRRPAPATKQAKQGKEGKERKPRPIRAIYNPATGHLLAPEPRQAYLAWYDEDLEHARVVRPARLEPARQARPARPVRPAQSTSADLAPRAPLPRVLPNRLEAHNGNKNRRSAVPVADGAVDAESPLDDSDDESVVSVPPRIQGRAYSI